LFNHTLSDKSVKLEINIYDATNHIFKSEIQQYTIPAWDEVKISGSTNLKQVKLWDIDNPYLYRLELSIISEEKITEKESVLFGIRKIEFTPDKGVMLNDRHIRIQGLCCHHDHAGVGIAVPDDVWEFRLRQMKKMGANAYRSAHHQASQVVLDLCDKLGILVLDETRRMSSSPEDIEQLKNMVKTDRNHPSVFLWGIGNEEIYSQDKKETEKTTITMKMEVRKLDKTRPITSAVVCWNGIERFDTARNYIHVTKNLDVMGFNYCKSAWDDYHGQQPTQPIIITEASANSWTRGCYETNEELGQYYIYDEDNEKKCKSGKKASKIDMAESEWRYFAERPYLSGIFLWTGIDYRGEPTPTAYPAVYSQFGIMDYCGFEKDNFYYYQSWWQDLPVLHIFPHWNYAQVGKNLTMYAYSNMDEVELLVNGKSYGKCAVEKNWYAKWNNVKYEPGKVTAIGYQNENEILRKEIKTTGHAQNIYLQAYKDSIDKENGVGIIKVSIEDADGNIVPTADNMLSVNVVGGQLLGTGNGNPGDHDRDNSTMRRAFNGLAEILVRPINGSESDKIVVTVLSEGLQSSKIVLLK
jgi:beta-galactosidase